jgi:hypothetical protein
MHQAPVIGLPAQAEAIRAREQTGRILSVIVSVFVSGLLLIAAAGAFWIWLVDRPRPTYLWLTLAQVLIALYSLVMVVGVFTELITQSQVSQLVGTLAPFSLAFWVLFWRDWFDLRDSWLRTWLPLALALLVALGQQSFAVDTYLSMHMIVAALALGTFGNFGLGILLVIALFEGARRDRTAALVALPAVLLLIISSFSSEIIAWARLRTSVFPFGIQVGVSDVALVLLVLVTGALAVRRFIGSQVNQRLERQTIDQELEQLANSRSAFSSPS